MGLFLLLTLPVSPCGASDTQPPPFLNEKGLCPFEGCAYREWMARKDTPLYSAPAKDAKVVWRLSAGTRVQALTGEVHTTHPGTFRVRKPYDKYTPGDVIWLYGYHGEGVYTVWFAGRLYQLEFSSINYDGQGGYRCDEKEWCWGVLEQAPTAVWWVQVRAPDGRTGWTKQPENFDGKDILGDAKYPKTGVRPQFSLILVETGV